MRDLYKAPGSMLAHSRSILSKCLPLPAWRKNKIETTSSLADEPDISRTGEEKGGREEEKEQ